MTTNQYRFDDPEKTCFKCKQVKPLVAFYRHSEMADGHLNKCIECTKNDVKRRYLTSHEKVRAYEAMRSSSDRRCRWLVDYQRKVRLRHPEKTRARQLLSYAIRSGKIERKPCEVCGCIKSEAHHEDYSKPLDVRWLCLTHHRMAHNALVVLEDRDMQSEAQT